VLRLTNFNINVINARLSLGVVISRVPRSGAGGNVAQAVNGDTPPVFWRVGNDWSAAACAAELVEQGLLSPSFCSDNVRTHFADMPLIGGNHLLFVDDGGSDSGVIRAAPGDTSWLVVSEMANVI